MRITDAEYLLALRAPSSGHLATLICTLTEALQNPEFSKHHRLLVAELLTRTQVTPTVASAADSRMQKFACELAAAEFSDEAIIEESMASAFQM
jgi:hypothetical protein